MIRFEIDTAKRETKIEKPLPKIAVPPVTKIPADTITPQSVTKKRGRPPKDGKAPPSEKQRSYRQRQKGK